MQRLKTFFLIVGLALLVYALSSAGGLAAIALSLLEVRWWLLLALIATFVAQLLRTFAWGRLLESYGGRVPFATLWRVRLIGEALNYLSFAGPFLGDPAKALLLSSETGFKKSGATVALDRCLFSISTVLFIAAVAAVWMTRWGIVIAAGAIVTAVLSPVLITRFNDQVQRSRVYTVIGLHLISNMFMVLEVGIILRGLKIDVTPLQAFFIEAMTKGLNGVFFFVPAQIGVSEGSQAVLLHYLKFAGTIGLTLGVARRIRSLFWSALGLVLMVSSRRRAENGGIIVSSRYLSQQVPE